MAYEDLKAAIRQTIKQNGDQEITGSILQSTLLSIVNTMGKGATFAGMATLTTDPGTPKGNVFYIAVNPGIYTNFNNLEVNELLVIISNKTGEWKCYNLLDNRIIKQKNEDITDLNNAPLNQLICSAKWNNVKNAPVEGHGYSVFTFDAVTGARDRAGIQFFIHSLKDIYVRCIWSTEWGKWTKITGLEEIMTSIYSNDRIIKQKNEDITDLNNAPLNQLICSAKWNNVKNAPVEGHGYSVFTFDAVTGARDRAGIQFFIHSLKDIYVRCIWSTEWGKWTKITGLEEKHNYNNILSAFNNIICIGDSLTYSQVYVSEKMSRQAYRTYPDILRHLCGCNTELYAHSGYTSIDSWNAYKDSYAEKNNALAIIYLGTNDGIQDTLDSDVIGDNPDNWSDNDIGCYCKTVNKLKSLGYKILLIKPWTCDGKVATLSETQKAIDNVANRFGCSVVGPISNKDKKYHYYPNLIGLNRVHYNDLGYAWFATELINSISLLSDDNLKYIIPS